MRVLMFGWEFPPHISGGLGTACYGLTKGLMEHGAEILFVLPRLFGGENAGKMHLLGAAEAQLPEEFTRFIERGSMKLLQVNTAILPYATEETYIQGFQDAYTETQKNGHSTVVHGLTGLYGSGLMEEVYRYASMAPDIAKMHKFDVVHAHDWLTFPAGMAASAFAGKPFVAHIHATEYDRSGDNPNREVKKIEKLGMETADRVIAVSEYTKKTAIKQYHIAENKVDVVHNGVLPAADNSVMQGKKHFPVVVFLGRVTFQKGPEYFLQAAAKVLRKNPDVRFVLAGHGDKLLQMITLAAQLRLSSRVSFTGFIQGEDISRLFGHADVYVMPSVSEPFGISALEAARAGVPVIISRQTGVAEVLNSAMKTEFWDTEAMADAILALLNHSTLNRWMSRNGQQQARLQTWNKAASRVLKTYSQLQL
ncbi:MAG: glycosyltransferase family 1 protein [Bacteroidetes bacterium]|nr:glycosyltransferase family 1 protein [Bacteroidota bacterium]